jgi:hypothetical protein
MTDRRNALGLGLVASAVALSGRTAHAADALSIDAGGVKIDRPLKIMGDNTLEFGADVSGKQGDAGKIGYGVFEPDSLCIVGAGTKGDNRRITFWAEGGAEFRGNLSITAGGPTLSVPGAQETLRLLRGVVTKDGTKFAGEGFTVTPVRDRQGLYDIVFTTPFPSIPGASVTQIFASFFRGNANASDEGGDTRDNAVISHLSADRMRVKTGGSGGGRDPRAFTFVVIGPR